MKPEGEHREELLQELLQKERKIAKLGEQKKAATRDIGGKIKAQERRRDELLDLLDGREHVEPELPLTTGKKSAPPTLVWDRQGENLVAEMPAGVYCIEPGIDANAGTFGLFWTERLANRMKEKSKELGQARTEFDAKELARRDWLDRGADAILENAGHGALTGKGRRSRSAP